MATGLVVSCSLFPQNGIFGNFDPDWLQRPSFRRIQAQLDENTDFAGIEMRRSTFILDAMSRYSSDSDLNDQEVSVLQRREQHGWFVNRIFENATGPAFAYSFGLYEEFGHPEIIIFGLPLETMHQLINDIGNQVRDGHRYQAGDRDEGLLRGYSCLFGNVNPLQYPKTFTWTMWFYEGKPFPALQLIWPDRENRFPYESDFQKELRLRQPDLSEPPPTA